LDRKIKALENNNHALVDDIYGKALLNFMEKPDNQEILVHSDIAESEPYPVSWFFRSNEEFPELEKVALELCKGTILDIGAGTGIHSLALQNIGMNVTALDISPGAVKCMQNQGVENALLQDFYTIEDTTYDTLLMLMNGFGIMGKVEFVQDFFIKADKLLNKGGQIIVDSSDLLHLYMEEDGSVLLDLNGEYYGEINYQMEFNGEKGHSFPWLFLDFGSLKEEAEKAGFFAEKINEDENRHYLAKITRM
jgi:cyclopropane fatty-acyl-phospholipid synthase-like methyltransferase